MERAEENVIEWLRDMDTVSVTLSQKSTINRVEKLAKEYPDEVQVLA